MNKVQLQQQLMEQRQILINQGIINDYFLVVESLQDDNNPNFLENLILGYFPGSAAYMDELEIALRANPMDYANVERLILKLKGGSASMGMAKFNGIVNVMFEDFITKRYGRLHMDFRRVREGHAALRTQFHPYLELLGRLRECRSNEAPGNPNHVDGESVDSNDDM